MRQPDFQNWSTYPPSRILWKFSNLGFVQIWPHKSRKPRGQWFNGLACRLHIQSCFRTRKKLRLRPSNLEFPSPKWPTPFWSKL